MAGTIRLATRDDAASVRSIYRPFVEETAISFEVDPPSVAAMADRIESALPQYPWLVCELGGEVVGYAAAGPLRSTPPYEWTVELSVYVDRHVQRNGVGTALYTSLFAVLVEQGYRNAYAVTTLPNPASTRFHEQLAFEPVGTFPAVGYVEGEWHDVRWWYRQLAPHTSDPEPPETIRALGGPSELSTALAAGETHLPDTS